jgi:hypothetical protein
MNGQVDFEGYRKLIWHGRKRNETHCRIPLRSRSWGDGGEEARCSLRHMYADCAHKQARFQWAKKPEIQSPQADLSSFIHRPASKKE